MAYYDEENFMSNAIMNSGPVLPVDPYSTGDMAVVNKLYDVVKKQATIMYTDKKQVNIMREMVRDLRSGYNIIFNDDRNDKEMIGRIATIVGDFMENDGSWIKTASSGLKGLGNVLAFVPGISTLWAGAAYAGGMFLDWYDGLATQDLCEMMSSARVNFFDNISSNMKEDGHAVTFRRLNSIDEKIETLSKWMLEKESEFYNSERVLADVKGSFHGIQFWKLNGYETDLYAIVIWVGLDSGNIYLKVIGTSSLYGSYDRLSMKHSDVITVLKNRISHRLAGNERKSIGCRPTLVSCCNTFCTEAVLRQRLENLSKVLENTRLSIEEMRTFSLMYLHLGIESHF